MPIIKGFIVSDSFFRFGVSFGGILFTICSNLTLLIFLASSTQEFRPIVFNQGGPRVRQYSPGAPPDVTEIL